MLYNDIEMSNHMRTIDVRGRGLTEQELTTLRVIGSNEDYVTYRSQPKRYLEIDYEIRAKDKESLRKKIDEVSAIIVTSGKVPVIFPDESDRTYFCEYDGVDEDKEYHHIGIHRGTIYLLRDKYKHGSENNLLFPADISTVENKGTAEALPIFELEAMKKTTFAMVSNQDDEYNLVGQPVDDDVQVVDTRKSVLYENGNTLDTWSTASLDMLDNHFVKKIGGTMTSDGAGIRANGYGTGEKLHGPAIYKEISPIQDFEIESTFDIISRREEENFRIGINFLDENMNMLGTIAIKDNSRTYKRRTPLARYGPYRGSGSGNGYLIGDGQKNDKARETTLFYLRAKRKGKRFNFYIGEWKNQKHVRSWSESYNDVNNLYQGKLKYITLYVAKWSDRPNPTRLRINSVEVFESARVTEDTTPYILYPGDILEFDHAEKNIRLNGETRKDLKNFGASFFTLKKGFNNIVVTPENSFRTRVKFRERYL